jgi:hypothetical protein
MDWFIGSIIIKGEGGSFGLVGESRKLSVEAK